MSEHDLTYADLLQIIELVERSSQFAEFHLKVGDIEIDLRKKGAAADANPALAPAPAGARSGEVSNDMTLPRETPLARAQSRAQYPPGAVLVKSPMVGTFYRAPEPGARPFVEIGDRVTPATTVCIIEVMKLMNSIAAAAAGVVTEILVENAAPVEFGQVLIVIESDPVRSEFSRTSRCSKKS